MTDPVVTLANDRLTVTVADAGAEMQSLRVAGHDVLWHGDGAWWGGRSPVLFPIVGRAEGDIVAVGDHVATMAQHGFARRSRFTRIAATATACRHELIASELTRAAYPFDFRLVLSHSLSGATVTVAAEVENRDTAPMPFGIGFHPAFLWPLPGHEGAAHEVVLDNGAEPVMARLSDGLLTGERVPSPFRAGRLGLAPELFADDAMIFPEGAGNGLRYGPVAGPKMHFGFENLPNLALWQKPGAPFLCIEPWHGMAAEAGAGPQIAARPFSRVLAPGDSARFAFSVRIEAL